VKTFLTVYDYGQGGVWQRITAESAEEIVQRYPELTVLSERPTWMTAADEAETRVLGIDDQDDPFLASLRRQADK
jgi:hypothetical protein